MKNIFCILILLITTQIVQAQSHSCCSAPDQFASLGNDPAFVMQHDAPIPFEFVPANGEMISYACEDGKDAHAYGIKAKNKSNQYLIVVHEWWGLNDYIKQMAEKLYEDLGGNLNVIAIDLYDGQVATEQKDAKTFMQSLSPERANAIIQGAIRHAGKDADIATIGWCMGGGYSLQTSILAGTQGIACVMYYGFPETDMEKLKKMNADVLMIWANQDKWITKEVVDQFKTNMETAGKKLVVKEYNADHAFANPSNPKFNEEAMKEAYALSLEFLRSKFK